MPYVASQNLLPILIALLIGFVTGLWIWKFARGSKPKSERVLTEDAPMRRPYVENRPPAPAEVPPRTFSGPRPEPEVLARRAPARVTPEDAGDNSVASSAAAALEDVTGQFLGVDAHPDSTATTSEAGQGSDDLQAMKGVGPKLASLLRAEGISRYDQIAALTPTDLARLDTHLGAFKGRLVRDRIVEQAAFLARGDREGYERAFGRL